MRDLRILCLFLSVMLCSTICYSQVSVTLLERNFNNRAKDLIQELSKTKDTLKLKSEINILRVSFFSHTDKKKLIVDLDFKEVNIPLHHLDTGRFTITVHRADKIIVLGINRLKTILKPKNAVANIEESIIEASLSIEKQGSRRTKALKSGIKKDDKTNEKRNTRVVLTPKRKPNKTKKTKGKVKEKSRLAISRKPVVQYDKKREEKAINGATDNVLVINKEKDATEKGSINIVKPEDLVNSSNPNKNVTYNITLLRGNDKTVKKQSREEYRKTHLRPNGKKYD
ncbi:hypothetical protein [Pontimicrobium sp. MEBiC01747]